MLERSLKGRLLVATPPLGDPFDRSVVLVLEHTAEGALGVVLNRPTDLVVTAAFPDWSTFAAPPAVIFRGGPVAPSALICLAEVWADLDADAWSPLLGRIGTLDLTRDPNEVYPQVEHLRVFAGYSGWEAGQLESEIDAGAWYVLDAAPEDPLSTDPDELWRTVLRRQGGRFAIIANHPPNLSAN